MKTGQTHVHKYMKTLMRLIEEGKVDPTVIISHRSAELGDGPNLYNTFRKKGRLRQGRIFPPWVGSAWGSKRLTQHEQTEMKLPRHSAPGLIKLQPDR
jgi:hypothetical protein